MSHDKHMHLNDCKFKFILRGVLSILILTLFVIFILLIFLLFFVSYWN